MNISTDSQSCIGDHIRMPWMLDKNRQCLLPQTSSNISFPKIFSLLAVKTSIRKGWPNKLVQNRWDRSGLPVILLHETCSSTLNKKYWDQYCCDADWCCKPASRQSSWESKRDHIIIAIGLFGDHESIDLHHVENTIGLFSTTVKRTDSNKWAKFNCKRNGPIPAGVTHQNLMNFSSDPPTELFVRGCAIASISA